MVANLLSLLCVAIFFIAAPVNAVSVDMVRHQAIARHISVPEPLAKRSVTGRCRTRPSSSIVHSTSTPPAPTSTKAPAPASTPHPSPSPAPAPAPNQSSGGGGKAGIAWALGNNPALKNFLSSKVSAVYTWNPASPPDLFGLEFIPMLWGYSQISDFQRLVVPGYATHVLGFNEPDLNTQSGIDAWTAASLWQQYIQPLKNHGYTLVSPATTSAPSGKKWMQDFISACHGCTIDVVALHWYGTNAQAFIAYVTDFHTTFNRNIWVTEFACQDFAGGPQADQDQVFAFMKTVTSWMDSTSFVEKYFAFGVMTDMGNVSPLNQLMNPDGTPTPLGWTYIG